MIFTCDRAKEVWKSLGIWSKIEEALHIDRSGSVLLGEIIRRGGREPNLNNVGLVELILTGGWYKRRQFVHENQIRSPNRSTLSIATLTHNYLLARTKSKTKMREGWKKPPEGKLMINVDAGFNVDSGSGSTGVVIRDTSGACIAAAQRYLAHVVDAPMVQAYAFREGLMMAQHIGINNFIIQTDCLQVEIVKAGGYSATASAAIFDDCCVLWNGFDNVPLEYCNREANRVAHELARSAFSSRNSCIWDDEPPSFILDCIVNDVTILSE